MADRPIVSLTAADFVWSYTKGTGAGGQKRNKTSSAVHCKHEPSGAHGYSEGSRSQHDNKREAFERCTALPKFKEWLRLETMRRTGQMAEADRAVERELKKIKVEIKQDGRWVPEFRCEYCGGNDETPQDHCMDCTRPVEANHGA